MSEGGRPRTVSNEEILAVVRQSEGQMVSTRDVTDTVSLSQRCVHARLEELVEEGRLETKTMGQRSRVWWVPE